MQKQNPLYIKLCQCLKRHRFNLKIKSAHFLLGVTYSKTNLEEIKQAVIDDSLNDLKARKSYDVRVDDIIEVYMIEETNKNLSILILLDPFELYTPEIVLEILLVGVLNVDKEEIFPC